MIMTETGVITVILGKVDLTTRKICNEKWLVMTYKQAQ
jgi:hypothetical protein